MTGDVTDRRAVRRAMRGVDRVFHAAGRTSMRTADREAVFDTNVRGARIVFEEALRAEVERVVHTSSVSAIGVARRGSTADETTPFNLGHLGIAYINSKHEAEMEGLRLAAHGLPVVFVNPTFVFGPDDPSQNLDGPHPSLPARPRSPPTSRARSTSSTSATSPTAIFGRGAEEGWRSATS